MLRIRAINWISCIHWSGDVLCWLQGFWSAPSFSTETTVLRELDCSCLEAGQFKALKQDSWMPWSRTTQPQQHCAQTDRPAIGALVTPYKTPFPLLISVQFSKIPARRLSEISLPFLKPWYCRHDRKKNSVEGEQGKVDNECIGSCNPGLMRC